MPVITSFPSTDLESGHFALADQMAFASPAPRAKFDGYGVVPSAFRLSDDGILDGGENIILCSDGVTGTGAAISLYRTAAGRLSERTITENLRLGYARFGIMTPWGADRPPTGYTVDQWYTHGGHIIRKVIVQAYGIGIRVAGYNTLLEDFILDECGGAQQSSVTGSDYSRTFGALFLGPNPVVRRGLIRKIVHGQPASGADPESVGLGFSADCHGGVIDDVKVINPELLPTGNSIAIWIGYSQGVTISNVFVENFKYALDFNQSTIFIKDSYSMNCTYGFGRLVADPNDRRVKLQNVWDLTTDADGNLQAVNVSNV